MALVSIQYQSPILTAEVVDDVAEHTSIEFPIEYMQEKIIYITAIEMPAVGMVGVPGNLLCWVEISPYPSVNTVYYALPLIASAVLWSAIGGGGGALPPIAPAIEPALGVALTLHTLSLPWAIHSNYARLIIQTPVAPAPGTLVAYWIVSAIYAAKTAG